MASSFAGSALTVFRTTVAVPIVWLTIAAKVIGRQLGNHPGGFPPFIPTTHTHDCLWNRSRGLIR